MTDTIREAITKEHDVFARDIVLIRPNTLAKTTHACLIALDLAAGWKAVSTR